MRQRFGFVSAIGTACIAATFIAASPMDAPTTEVSLELPGIGGAFTVVEHDGELVLESSDGFITASFTLTTDPIDHSRGVFLLPGSETLLLGWTEQKKRETITTVLDLDSGEVVATARTPRNAVFESAAIVSLMESIFMQGCDPSFETCVESAKDACDPLRAAVSYSCVPETGEVSCSWACVQGPGGGGD